MEVSDRAMEAARRYLYPAMEWVNLTERRYAIRALAKAFDDFARASAKPADESPSGDTAGKTTSGDSAKPADEAGVAITNSQPHGASSEPAAALAESDAARGVPQAKGPPAPAPARETCPEHGVAMHDTNRAFVQRAWAVLSGASTLGYATKEDALDCLERQAAHLFHGEPAAPPARDEGVARVLEVVDFTRDGFKSLRVRLPNGEVVAYTRETPAQGRGPFDREMTYQHFPENRKTGNAECAVLMLGARIVGSVNCGPESSEVAAMIARRFNAYVPAKDGAL